MPTPVRADPRIPQRQRGAALYVALILLILLALLGLVGMQVTGMQERMSSNYVIVNRAFQNAEAQTRGREAQIQAALFGPVAAFVADDEQCRTDFDPAVWGNDPNLQLPASHVRRIDKCFASSSLVVGRKQNEDTGNIYQVTAARADTDSRPLSRAVIDTVFIP